MNNHLSSRVRQRMDLMLCALRTKGPLSRAALAQEAGCSIDQTRYLLPILRDCGLIESYRPSGSFGKSFWRATASRQTLIDLFGSGPALCERAKKRNHSHVLERADTVLQYLKAQGPHSITQMMHALDISERKMRNAVFSLKNRELIHRSKDNRCMWCVSVESERKGSSPASRMVGITAEDLQWIAHWKQHRAERLVQKQDHAHD